MSLGYSDKGGVKAGESLSGRGVSIMQTLWSTEFGIGRIGWSTDKEMRIT